MEEAQLVTRPCRFGVKYKLYTAYRKKWERNFVFSKELQIMLRFVRTSITFTYRTYLYVGKKYLRKSKINFSPPYIASKPAI
jgi:hypothetical protein